MPFSDSTPTPTGTLEIPPPPARSLAGHQAQGAPLAPEPAAIVIPTQEDIDAVRAKVTFLRDTYRCPSCHRSSLVEGTRKRCGSCRFFTRGNPQVHGKALREAREALGITFRDRGTPKYEQAFRVAELASVEALADSYRLAHVALTRVEVAS